MTNEGDRHTLRPDNIDPATLEIAEIVQRGMAAWSERIARTVLDRLSIHDRRSRATDEARTASSLRGNGPKAEGDQS